MTPMELTEQIKEQEQRLGDLQNEIAICEEQLLSFSIEAYRGTMTRDETMETMQDLSNEVEEIQDWLKSNCAIKDRFEKLVDEYGDRYPVMELFPDYYEACTNGGDTPFKFRHVYEQDGKQRYIDYDILDGDTDGRDGKLSLRGLHERRYGRPDCSHRLLQSG